jgi:cysteine-rich repeat protein
VRALIFTALLSGCSFVIELPELPLCGDGVLDPDEACDDGNATAGDGCNPGCELPTETVFNTTVGEGQSNGRLAFFSTGALLVAFEDDSSTPPDVGSSAVRARHYDASGSPTGPDFVVHEQTAGDQEHAEIAAAEQALIVWDDPGADLDVRGRVFTQNGSAVEPDFPLAESTAGDQRYPAVASSTVGFFAAWIDDELEQIRGRQLDVQGSFVGSELTIATAPITEAPAISGGADRYLVVETGIRGRLINGDGTFPGDDFALNEELQGKQDTPAVASGGGLFLVAWNGTDGDGLGVRARRIQNDGSPLDTEFGINTITSMEQNDPSIAVGPAGFYVVWEDESGAPPDPSNDSVRGLVLPIR